jgi:ADP-heptose:LPS heptosyltransferase
LVRQIAIVRLDNLGDHVLGAGLIAALRAQHPRASLKLVVPEVLAALYARCPAIDGLHTLPRRLTYVNDGARFEALIRRLRAGIRADLIINPRFAEDFYLAGPICGALAAESARIVGFRQVSSPYPGYEPNAYYGELVDAPEDLHASRYAALMATHLGAGSAAEPAVWFSAEDLEAVRTRCRLDAQPFVVLGCGASAPCKYPELESYHHVVRRLVLRHRRRVILTGLATERADAAAIVARAPAGARILSSVGELSLPELAALLSLAELYIGPDAGPMHMAAAAGSAVLELGWVPAGEPTHSRGPLNGGDSWRPWSPRALTVRPHVPDFAQRRRAAGFQQQRCTALASAEIDAALAQLLGGAERAAAPEPS